MHILLISHYWEPEQGVVQRRWQWLSEALRGAGHHLTVIAPPPHYPGGKLLTDEPRCQTGAIDDSKTGLTIYRTAFTEHDQSIVSRVSGQAKVMQSQLACAAKAIRRARRQGHPVDAVCCTVPALPSAVVAYLVAKRHALPFILELRDAWPEILDYLDQWYDHDKSVSLPMQAKLSLFHILMKLGGKALGVMIKDSDAVITTTKSLARLERAKGCRNVITVRNRANSGIPNCNEYPQRETGPLRILYAGTVGRAQGIESAIEALSLAQQSGTEIEMRVVGSGAHLKPVRRKALDLKAPVEFFGRVSFDEVTNHYRWADSVLVHLQDWEPMEYTIPSKLFEAMWAEKHVTAAVAGEAAQIVETSQIGDVVPPMNPEALAQLWANLARNRDRLNVDGNGSAWFATNQSLEQLSEEWMKALSIAVEEHRSRSHSLKSRVVRLLKK
ncbi:glycosyltransferase family 4 protein [Corynebacterium aquilae]|uniref:glycosyltransferase family 4 protein n=1 Tax=Corynebacterium aquilae TaxID=203263 RepID=UPI0009514919|nr:glycosyltransferase family 4 protein [Corynebacterium aquilae]